MLTLNTGLRAVLESAVRHQLYYSGRTRGPRVSGHLCAAGFSRSRRFGSDQPLDCLTRVAPSILPRRGRASRSTPTVGPRPGRRAEGPAFAFEIGNLRGAFAAKRRSSLAAAVG